MQQGNLRQEEALKFILGGNALFTIKSLKTGTRFTYKVLHDCKREGYFKVSYLNGTDNTKDYKQIGFISPDSPYLQPISIHTKELTVFKAFDHVFLNLSIRMAMPLVEIWHEGRCCRCGRVLTVPESISNGIGPECIFKM
jgi:Family of unknown function (DUF6011)